MANTAAHARKWTEFVAGRAEFPAGRALLAQFEAGRIESLCTCGCHSYVFTPASLTALPSIASSSGTYGSVFELLFRAGPGNATVEFLLSANAEGNLAGMDVHFCGNSSPMPEAVVFLEPPIHVRLSDSVVA